MRNIIVLSPELKTGDIIFDLSRGKIIVESINKEETGDYTIYYRALNRDAIGYITVVADTYFDVLRLQ